MALMLDFSLFLQRFLEINFFIRTFYLRKWNQTDKYYNLQFLSELITTQLREFHMVSPQVVFTLLIFLTMQSYKWVIPPGRGKLCDRCPLLRR